MTLLVIALAAFFAASLTLFSGFGVGTLLLPVFAIFFPMQLAVAMTAMVHLANNLFKLALLGRHADFGVVLRFGIPAIIAAIGGATLLGMLSEADPLHVYRIADHVFVITPVKLTIAVLMAFFAYAELMGIKRHKPEEIVQKLRQVEVLVGQGTARIDAIREIGITEQTYYRWRKKYGGMGIDQLKELKRLQKENERLRKAVSDLTLDKQILSEAAKGNF
ncbi:sulfite exporter TauE/SafE family protein, partial [Solemya velum gill symbiont]